MLLAGATPDIEGDLYVIGSGVGRSVADIVTEVEQVLGKKLVVEVDDVRLRPEASEVDRLICDFSLARRKLGYEPRVSFSDGLRATADWLASTQRSTTEYTI